jgi:energy-coupling factor transporter ATP-binding protein EcfA2
MDVLKEIYDWSDSRPVWQRDALRRLITQSGIEDSDVSDLAELCKSAHGLSEPITSAPLEERHIRSQTAQMGTVNITSVIHHRGVNALANEQKLEFGQGLTVVYGANAAGKSGFTRILKSACRARGSEEVLGNILADAPPPRPSATISVNVSGTFEAVTWDGGNSSNEALSRVSVFDSQSAAVYLTEKTDVAFRPLGLDIFDRLSELCGQVRRRLENEKRALANVPASLPRVPEGAAVHRLLSNITSLTDPNAIKRLASLSAEEGKRLTEIKRTLTELESQDPRKTAGILDLRSRRLSSLKTHVERVSTVVSDAAVTTLFDQRAQVHAAHDAAATANQITFLGRPLKGLELDLWRRLWEAARQFSARVAYPGKQFPVTEQSHCVLCQQEIARPTTLQLQGFEKAVQSTAQQDYDRIREQFAQSTTRLEQLQVITLEITALLEELRVENEAVGDSLINNIGDASSRKDLVLEALKNANPRPTDLPPLNLNAALLDPIAAGLKRRAQQIVANNQDEVKRSLTIELHELEARATLGEHLDSVINEIEKKKKLAAYEVCLKDTDTTYITRKSTEVTSRTVTEQLAASFQSELQRLKFTHVEVELQQAGGVRGTLYHKLVLRRSPDSDLPSVLSEGEARCLSIAAFFAELSTAQDQSAVLFDDPVSSLDHIWRERVASRLVTEAAARQVIVFTHDIVFLLALTRFAEDHNVTCQHQQLRREGFGAGVTSPDLPWAAMKLRQRIGALRNRWQTADALLRKGTREDYEREGLFIYGLLREAWERGMEEVLLGGIVERYRPNVETLRAKVLSDITNDDCEALEAG